MTTARPLDPDACAALVASNRWTQKVREDVETGCLIWTGCRTGDGYGTVWLGSRTALVHRVAWVAANGRDIPEGLVLDHRCRTRACCRADHVTPVTSRENTLAPGSLSPSAAQAARTHCPRGHDLAGDNLRRAALARGQRDCLTCDRARRRARSAGTSAAARALSMTHRAYVTQYGWSAATAREVLAALDVPRIDQTDDVGQLAFTFGTTA